MMRQHDWSEPDTERVRTCRRTGCGVQQMPQVGMLRTFGWRRSPGDHWRIGMIPCAGEAEQG
jgi:hypothetical protein